MRVRVTVLDPHSFRLEWQSPLTPNGQVSGISYLIVHGLKSDPSSSKHEVVAGSSATIDGLDPDTEYSCQVLICVLTIPLLCMLNYAHYIRCFCVSTSV